MQNKRSSVIGGVFKLFAKYQPMYYAYFIPLIAISSIIPLISVWLPKVIIEYLISDKKYENILFVIGIYVVVLILTNVIKNILTLKTNIHVSRFKFQLQLEVGRAAMDAAIKDIENAKYQEEIIMAGRISNITDIMNTVRNLISEFITILGLAYIIVKMDIIFFVLIGFTLTVKIIFSIFRFKLGAKLREEEACNGKKGNYIDQIQYFSDGAAKELRVNNAQNWLFKKITDFRECMLEIQFKSFKQYRIFEIIQLIVIAMQNVLILVSLANCYMTETISIADFSLYFSSVTLLSITLSNITDQIINFSQKLLNCSDYNKIVNIDYNTNKLEETYKNSNTIAKKISTIKFENISFTYPGTDTKVLENVSFELKCGDRAMLVGKNGSGKTTIIKLLCKFYRPDTGRILFDDVDISTIPPKEYYSLIATMFQDFATFYFSINENISMGTDENTVNSKVQNSLEKVGLDSVVANLKDKGNSYISTLFSQNGVRLSGGEMQRLGLARAIYKDASILILDEPTANLDVKIEDELYKKFYDIANDKISLTISHRLSQAITCNKIYVLDSGKICENGTHDELMAKNGIYAKMFKKQREAYVV